MSTPITFPGLIDCHVHFREPGLEHKEDMESGAAAALAGGVTTVCEMPNTNPSTTSIIALKDKVERSKGVKNVDIRFFFGITEHTHVQELRTLWTDDQYESVRLKCCGVKVFFDHSTGDQGASLEVIEEAFKACAELGIPLVAHCEDSGINAEAERVILEKVEGDMSDVSLHSLMRPCASEASTITQAITFARKHGTQFHIAHLSTAQGIESVRKAKKEGLPITCEVAPHHLLLSTNDYATLGTLGKMNPPLRTPENAKALWDGIADSTVDCIGTDHAPHLLEEKQADEALSAPSGVPGVETSLPLLLTVAAGGWPHPSSKRPDINFSYEDIIKLCFKNPNHIFNLGKSKKDQFQIDSDAEWTIHGKDLHSKCGWTPYEGWKVKGKLIK